MAVADRDLKRLLAASTSSQYGFMLLAVGAGSPVAALAHLTAHAAMKSSLFLGSGVFQARPRLDGVLAPGGHRTRKAPDFRRVLDSRSSARRCAAARRVLVQRRHFSSDIRVSFRMGALSSGPCGNSFDRDLRRPSSAAVVEGRGSGRACRRDRVGWAPDSPGSSPWRQVWGLALGPIAGLVGGELPKDMLIAMIGTVVALGGLALGWFVPAGSLFGPFPRVRRTGLPPSAAASTNSWPVRRSPWRRATDSFDGGIHRGRDRRRACGGLAVAQASRLTDEKGIDGLIFALVRGTRDLGRRARRLQNGARP